MLSALAAKVPRHVYDQVLNAMSSGQLAPSTARQAMQLGSRVPLQNSSESPPPPLALSPMFFEPWSEHKKSLMALKDHLRRVSTLHFKCVALHCMRS